MPLRGHRLTLWLLIVAAILLPICGLVCAYFWPRWEFIQQRFGCESVGYYHGLGRHGGPGFFGKNWYLVREEWQSLGTWQFQIDGDGWAAFRARYANGDLMAEGTCWVESINGRPSISHDRVLCARYYDPDGNLASQVQDGSGRLIIYYSDGTKRTDVAILNERINGSYAIDWDDGTPMGRGNSDNGKAVGTWLWFHQDGSLSSIDDHSVDPPVEVEYEPGEKMLSDEEIAQLLAP